MMFGSFDSCIWTPATISLLILDIATMHL